MGITAPIAAEGAAKGGESAGLLGAGKGAEAAAGAAGAADVLGPAAAAGAPLDLLSLGAAADTAIPAGVGALETGAGGALASGLAAEGILPAGAAGIALPGGLDAGVGLTSLVGGQGIAPGALDSIAAGATPSGSPISAASGASAPSLSGGVGAVAPPAGINAPVDLASAASAPGGQTIATGLKGADAASGSMLDNLLGGATSSITKNPLGVGLAAAGLGLNLAQGQKQSAAVKAMADQAAAQAAQGATLSSYLEKGTLPPAVQANLTQAKQAAKARILSNYANTPGGADPSKNSALAQELNNLDIQAIASAASIEQQLLQSGQSAAGLSSNLYAQLAQIDATQTANMGKAIANFASALSPSPGVTLKAG